MTREELLASIATTIHDYRAGEIAQPSAEHVDRWVTQFDEEARLPILSEIDHVLKKTYFSRDTVLAFLNAVLIKKELASSDPCSFWPRVGILNIQLRGDSQREMIVLFDELLFSLCGLHTSDCGTDATTFVYLDDAIFTGNHVRNDLQRWIGQDAPKTSRVHIVTIAYHEGKYYAEDQIQKAAKAAGKTVHLKWWACLPLEDRNKFIAISDVLRPTRLPQDPQVVAYAEGLKYAPTFRPAGKPGRNNIFSSEAGRDALEQNLLKAGVRIKGMCPYLSDYQRPLGNMILETLGFGSMIVTFRNCPNNAPLAFWAGDPWYPLFERKTN